MRSLVVLVVLLASSTAHADPWLDFARRATGLWSKSQEDDVRARIDEARALYQLYAATTEIVEQRIDATVTVGAGADRGDVTSDVVAGVQYTAQGTRCDVLKAGASGRAGYITSDDPAIASAQQWAELCLDPGIDGAMFGPELTGLFLFPLRFRESVVLNTTPRRSAPRAAFDERYSEAGFGFYVEGARYEWRTDHGAAMIGFASDQFWRWRGMPDGESRTETSGEMWFVRLYHHRGADAPGDRHVDFFVIGFHGIQADNGAAIIDFVPLRLTGLGFGQQDVLFDASVGIAGTGTITTSTSGPGVDDMTTIGTTGLPDITRASAHIAAYGGPVTNAFSLSYDRSVDTNLFADVIVEDRGSISVRQPFAGGSTRAAAFVSRAVYFLDEDVVARERLVGAALDAEIPVGRGLSLALAVDGAFGLGAYDDALDGHAPARGFRGLLELRAVRTPWRSQPRED